MNCIKKTQETFKIYLGLLFYIIHLHCTIYNKQSYHISNVVKGIILDKEKWTVDIFWCCKPLCSFYTGIQSHLYQHLDISLYSLVSDLVWWNQLILVQGLKTWCLICILIRHTPSVSDFICKSEKKLTLA